MIKISRRSMLVNSTVLLASALFSSRLAWAEKRSACINFIIPFSEGGSFDRTSRGVGTALVNSGLAKCVTFESVIGDGGAKAYKHLIESSADNSDNIMLLGSSILCRRAKGQYPYDVNDLSLVSLFSAEVLVFAVRADSSLNSIADLVRTVKLDPKLLRFASDSDAGLSEHLCATKMLLRSGVDPKTVNYRKKTGHDEHIHALLAGEVDVVVAASWDILDLYRDKSVRILAVSSDQRVEQMPDIPTLTEAGISDGVFYNARWFFMPPNTDFERRNSMGSLLQNMIQSTEWSAQKEESKVTTISTLDPDGKSFLESQYKEIEYLHRVLGISL